MPLPQQVPDLPDKYEQRRAWELENATQSKGKAKKLVSFAKYTPLAFVVPFVQWLLDVWPSSWLRSADGRGEAEFHYWVPRSDWKLDPSRFMLVDGDVYYFTARDDRFGDMGLAFGGSHDDQWSGWLYKAQSKDFQDALPWRVTLWEDTELPANVPLKLPAFMVQHLIEAHGLPFVQSPTMANGQAFAEVVPKGKGLNIDAPKQGTSSTTARKGSLSSELPSSSPSKAPGAVETGNGIVLLGVAIGAALLAKSIKP